jgi:predicted RNase H-like HicB family nuclease
MVGQFTAVYLKQGQWIVAYVEEIPGVNTQGKTLKEARKNLKEALLLVLETNRELSQRTLRPKSIVEPIAVAA